MLTTHGIHQWRVIPGLQDTGGQNVFVNDFADELAQRGYKVTIVNRGGYKHPETGKLQSGIDYKNQYQRIVYLDDGLHQFVRKEDMADRIPQLVKALNDFVQREGTSIDLMISNYWDAGIVAATFKKESQYNPIHVWIPHSLGEIKKMHMPSQQWEKLRIEERINAEFRLLEQVDAVAATSDLIQKILVNNYQYKGKMLWLPPCIDNQRYHARQVKDNDPVWQLLSAETGLPPEEIRKRKIITEISRTDVTKRKDILIEAFAQIHTQFPNTFLIISIDDNVTELAQQLRKLIHDFQIESSVAVVGSIWDFLPNIYAISDIYCTSSITEGFGMSAEEAAATGVPVVATSLVPFATEYLLGDDISEVSFSQENKIQIGKGAIVVPPFDVDGISVALEKLLSDEKLRLAMGKNAYEITIPYFTWEQIVEDFLKELGLK